MLDNSWLQIYAKLVDVVAGEIFGSLMILSKGIGFQELQNEWVTKALTVSYIL